MPTGTNDPNTPKRDRRELAREAARLQREQMNKKRRRGRLAGQLGVAGGIVAVLAIIAVVIVFSISGSSVTGPRNMASDGILLQSNGNNGVEVVKTAAQKSGDDPVPTKSNSKVVQIVEYVDFQCPFCMQFEQTNATQIKQLVSSGAATLEVHPISILDASSNGNRYSTRAANAAACVAQYQPNTFLDVMSALYAKQPAENTNGMTDAALTKIVTGAGADSSSVTKCITDGTFDKWVTAETNRVRAGNLPNSDVKTFAGTPTVIVNGQSYSGSLTDADTFASFVTSVSAATATTTPTPSATPTATTTPTPKNDTKKKNSSSSSSSK